jgi:hypothetical protein
MPIIPATLKAEAGGSEFEINQRKVSKTLSRKQNTKQKGWGCGSNGRVLA